MDTDTYPNAEVQKFFAENLVALRVDTHDPVQKKTAEAMSVIWTPTFVLMQFEPTGGTALLRILNGWYDPQELIAELKKGIEGHKRIAELAQADPKDVEAQVELGELLWREGKNVPAQAAWKAAVDADPKNAKGKTPAALYGLCRVAIARDAMKEAQQSIQALLELDPKNAQANRGKLALEGSHRLLGQKKFKEAAEGYGRVAKDYAKSDTGAEAQYWLGVACVQKGDMAGFQAAWNTLVTDYPTSVWAKRSAWQKK